MHKKKRFFSILVAVCLVITMVPLSTLLSQASYTGALQFGSDGKFTVMQIADTQDTKNINQRVINVISNAISRYDPDLVVFTGDNIIETITSTSAFEDAADAVMAPLINSQTLFAVTFGNHDKDPTYGINAPSKTVQYNYYKSHGGSYFVDHDVLSLAGVGSGIIPIYANGQTSGTPKYQIYLMDSGSDPSSGEYDACYTNQIDYYIQNSQANPTIPSLWFQHIMVPDIYTECMTTTNNGTGVSYDGWYLQPDRITWDRCSSTILSDVYNEAPGSTSWSLYQSAAHRSSATYGSKTLYEAWCAYGQQSLKGCYFGHDHLNEFTCTTDDGIILGYGEGTTLYATLGLYDYNDNNPGVSIYELDDDGAYTNEFVDEEDLAIPVYDPTAPLGNWRIYAETLSNGSSAQYNCGTDENVYFRLYSGNGGTGNLLYQSPDLQGTESGGNSGNLSVSNVPTTNLIKSMQIILPTGTDDWICDRVMVYYTPSGGTEQLIWDYDPNYTVFDEGEYVNYNTSWFQTNNHTVTFNANGGTGGTMATQNLVWGTTKGLLINAFTKTGYSFQGWSTSSAGAVQYANGANITMGTGNIVLYAKWAANTYTVEYSGNGHTGGSTSSSIHTYNVAKNLATNGFTKTGHTFSGWATSPTGVVVYTNAQSVTNLEASGMTILYAVWAANQYTIIYNGNGSTSGSTANSLHVYGVNKNLSSNGYAKTGYAFSGWSTSNLATSPSYLDNQNVINITTIPNGVISFYAVWSTNSYTIIFNANGGTGGTSASMQYGSSLTAPVVTKTGYNFLGWSPEVSATVPASNMTYTAQWVANNYNITFDANGGTGGTGGSMAYGSALSTPVVSRVGYTLTGWTPSVPATVPAANTTYTAQWTVAYYNITFDATGGTGSTGASMPYGVSLTPPAVIRDGYVFMGWSPQVPATVPAADTTYVAQWSLSSNNLTLLANGGIGGISTMLDFGLPITPPIVSKEGCVFTGWVPALPSTVVHGLNIYEAKWVVDSYLITFDANGGTGGTSSLMGYGMPLAAPAVANTGFTFTGWSPSIPSTAPAANTTYTAQWSRDEIEIIFDANGGTGGTDNLMTFGDIITPPVVSKAGYVFIGWLPAVPSTVVAGDQTHMAQWMALS